MVAPDSLLAKVGPDGKKHDSFFTTDSTNVKAGDVVSIVVTNYDDMPHGMAFDTIAINQLVNAGPGCHNPSACKAGESTVTTFSFTATKAGVMRWHCPMPCDTDNATVGDALRHRRQRQGWLHGRHDHSGLIDTSSAKGWPETATSSSRQSRLFSGLR